MLSIVDQYMIKKHVNSKRRSATNQSDKLRRNGVDYAHRLDKDATSEEIAAIISNLGIPTSPEEVETILDEIS